MKYFRITVFASLVLLTACSKQGDPGPQGEPGIAGAQGIPGPKVNNANKKGVCSGTVTGTKKDGTAFNEAFKYEFSSGQNQYAIQNGEKHLSLYRSDSIYGSYTTLGLKLINEGTPNESLSFDSTNSFLTISFLKPLTSTQAFYLYAEAYLSDIKATIRPLALQKNLTYNFALDLHGDYSSSGNSSSDFTIFYTNDNKKVYYDKPSGNLIMVTDADDVKLPKDNVLYSALRYDSKLNKFFDVKTKADLSETQPAIPGDSGTVSNYVYDVATGIVSFDFSIAIAGYGRNNSTHNPITVVGKFNSGVDVYKNIVGRKGN